MKRILEAKRKTREKPVEKGTNKQTWFGNNQTAGLWHFNSSRQGICQISGCHGGKDLLPIITKKVKIGSSVCSDTWRAYTGLAAKGYVHRTVEHGEKEYVQKTTVKITSMVWRILGVSQT